MKKFKDFVNENNTEITAETDIPNITPEELKLINKIKKLTLKSNVEGDHTLYFKEPLPIGKYEGKPVYCNYFYLHENTIWKENYLVFHILYNETKSKLYDKEFEFSLLNYGEIKSGIHNTRLYDKENNKFLDPIDLNFEFIPDFLDKIYKESSKLDDVWIKKCDDAKKESREWVRISHANFYKTNYQQEISWDRELQHVKSQIFYDKILNGRQNLPDIRRLKEMEELGEEAYKKKAKEQSDRIKELMKDWDFKNIKENYNFANYFVWRGCSRWTNASKSMAVHISHQSLINGKFKQTGYPLCGKHYKGGCLDKYQLTEENLSEVTCPQCLKLFKEMSQKLTESLAYTISYEEWSNTTESEKTIQVSRETTRDIYQLPDGTYVYDHFVSPYSPFKKSYSYTVVDLTLELNDFNKELVEKYGGYISEDWGYTDEGYGLPLFKDDEDSLKIAFEFVKNEKDKLVMM